ncbi:hypothetical protein FB451DRAFT_1240207 [Mycena latifolia]|nr:hypothetical protein FB451DRAFT_1240207 [Mycena latifolia]
MKISYITAISLLLHASIALSKSCDGGECVSLYRGSDCQPAGELTDYVPTCGGNCYQFNSFDSVAVSGGFADGTDCHIFSDINCQNEITDTGNVHSNKCVNTPGAQSMICYYAC